MNSQLPRRIVVAVTGASGMLYAASFLKFAAEHFETVYLVVSENAVDIIRQETGFNDILNAVPGELALNVTKLDPGDIWSAPASGSHFYEGMVVIPCSMGSLGRIAAGVSEDLITRIADVCLKERRKLVLAVRETPYSIVHLRNMTALAEAGAIILPASPGFYHNPKDFAGLADFITAKIAAQFGFRIKNMPEWTGSAR